MDTGADSIRFAGFMSRCMMPAEWQYFSAFINCENDPLGYFYTVVKNHRSNIIPNTRRASTPEAQGKPSTNETQRMTAT